MSKPAPTVLVPVDVSTEERPDPELLDLLRPARVVLVGWYPVPDQTAPEQLHDEHEEEAVDRIEAIAEDLSGDSADVETLVVFTRDRSETVDRVSEEYGCEVVVVPSDVRVVDRVLVPIRSDVNADRILHVVGALLDESDVSVTLFHAVEEDEDEDVGDLLLDSAAEELVEAGVDSERIQTVTAKTGSPVDDIVDAASNHDVIIIGETEPSLVDQILGDVPTRIIEQSGRPVLVVRKTG